MRVSRPLRAVSRADTSVGEPRARGTSTRVALEAGGVLLEPRSIPAPPEFDAEGTPGSDSPPVPAVLGVSVPISAQADAHAEGNGASSARFRSLGRDAVYRRFLALADVLAAVGAVFISTAVTNRHDANIVRLATVPLIVVISKLLGAYDREGLLMRKSTLDEAPALFQIATVYALLSWLIDGLLITGTKGRRDLLALWIGAFLLLLLFRAGARLLSRRLTVPERCLLVGDPATCARIQVKFAGRPSLHTIVVANVEPEELDTEATPLSVHDLHSLAQRLRIDRIIITPRRADDAAVINLIHAATSTGLKVSVLPRLLEVAGSSVAFDDVEGIPLLSMRGLGLNRSSRMVKRTVDIIGAGLAVLALAPAMIIAAIAIKLDSSGPVFFRQCRIGRNGTPFKVLKFRTMVVGADEHKHEFLHLNQADGLFKIADDPRITRVGRFLRRTSLDELPQLLNVVRGEMSLVGPRPLIEEEDRRIEGWRRRRLQLTPGMTGHWQILGSARVPLEEMARIDYLYVTSWSLWLDVKILLRTIPYVLARRGQ